MAEHREFGGAKLLSFDTGKAKIMLITFPSVPGSIVNHPDGWEANYYLPQSNECKTMGSKGVTYLAQLEYVTEKQWSDLMVYQGLPFCAYKDYTNPHNWFNSAKLSANSLFVSHEYQPEPNTHLFIINNK